MIVPGDFSPGRWGWFTLVCYVPDPPRAQLDQLRRLIPGTPTSPLHITVLPPRPLLLPIEEAWRKVVSIVEGVRAFEIELADIEHFVETQFLYLAIADGSEVLHQLHAEMNGAELNHQELFEFRPHLTLGGPVAAAKVWELKQRLQAEWRAARLLSRSFRVEEFVCLWIPPGRHEHWQWDRFGSFTLRSPVPAANRT